VGSDELEEIMAEFGIEGDDDEVGADPAEKLRAGLQRAAGRGALPRRRIVTNAQSGRPRQLPLMFTRSIALADAGTDTLTATADRASLVRALHLQANSGAGVLLYGASCTSLQVSGRNARVGSGFCADFALRTWALQPMHGLSLGIVSEQGTVTVGVINDCGAAADVSAGALAETTD
jgi:hypothetical protein